MATYMYIKLQENSICYNTPSKSITHLKDKLVGETETQFLHMTLISIVQTPVSQVIIQETFPPIGSTNESHQTGVRNYTGMAYTVKPPNKGHIGDGPVVPCREVVLFLEVFF